VQPKGGKKKEGVHFFHMGGGKKEKKDEKNERGILAVVSVFEQT